MKTAIKIRLLYVGGFILPDNNAAAQRVIANAKLFNSLDFEVVFINYSDTCTEYTIKKYFGFKCYEFPSSKWREAHYDIRDIEFVLENEKAFDGVVLYNYPSAAFRRILKYCERRNIKCISDVTEWYSARDYAINRRLVKYLDIVDRMRFLNQRCDGVIAISSYLSDFYSRRTNVLRLPPLVDKAEKKWHDSNTQSKNELVRFVYAGSPSKTKERLDLIVSAVEKLPNSYPAILEVVGINGDAYYSIYGKRCESNRVIFHGRVPHESALDIVARCDYSIIIRDRNRVTQAGFPTKFVEAISCGTAVVCNDNSDLKEYIDSYGCGVCIDEMNLSFELQRVIESGAGGRFDSDMFDYNYYKQAADSFLKEIFR